MTTSKLDHFYANSTDITSALNKLDDYLDQPDRVLIGLTGGPGSGKSTLAAYLASSFNTQTADQIACLSMDGFHLSKAQLRALPDPDAAFARRGAPWTFDSAAFVQRVKDIKHAYFTKDVLWPSFDHSLGDPLADDLTIHKDIKVVLVEGLYLLHQNHGWQDALSLFDEHWFLDVPLDVSIERLAQRHMAAWGMSHEQAMERIMQNDGRNAELVESSKGRANWLLSL